MKKLVTLFALIPMFYAAKAQDTIANPGFENWTNNPSPAYDEPNSWHTLNPYTSAIGAVMAYKGIGSDAHTGNNGIKLISKPVLNSPTASLVTTGTVNVAQQSVDGGIPINSRPVSLNGWFKYSPVGGDTATFAITLTKWNGTSRVLVGQGGVQVDTAVSVFTNFSVPVNYLTADVPDTVQILFVSSTQNAAHANTILVLDDISYDFATGIAESPVAETSLFPNPAEDMATLKFNVDNNQTININLYNTLGQQVRNIYTGNTGKGTNQVQFSTAGLPSGMYIVKLNIGTKTVTRQLVVK